MRQRGVFPLPTPECEPSPVQNLSRACSRRLKRRERVHDWVSDIVHSLNSMYAGDEFMASFDPALKPTCSE